MNVLENAVFVRSAASAKDFPSDGQKHIVFAGRSNVGKSSLINRLAGKKNFARVSSKPGKTVFVNLFKIDGGWMVDLPGYGFSQTSVRERERFSKLVDDYFDRCGKLIACAYLIVDCRRDPMPDDLTMADYFRAMDIPFIIVSNKTDKLSKTRLEESCARILEGFSISRDLLLTVSAESGAGKDDLLGHIVSVFGK